MAENRKLTQKDIDVIGTYPEATKGTAVDDGSEYNAIKGYINEFSYRVDDDRKEHNRSGDGPMQSDQSIGQRKVSGRLHYKVNQDYVAGEDADTSMLYLALGKNSMPSITDGRIFPRGTKCLDYDAGAAFSIGEILSQAGGNTPSANIVHAIGTATGTLIIDKVSGDFVNDVALATTGTGSGVADGANYEVGPELDSFTIWCKQKNFPSDGVYNHVLTGCHIQKLNIRGLESGDVEFDIEFKAFDVSHTGLTSSTLPSQPYTKGGAFFNWTSADASVFTVTRAGSEARVKTWDITIDNGELHFVPQSSHAYAADFIPGMLNITGNLEFYLNDTELYTIWDTDPNTDKTLTHSAATLTTGDTVKGQISGAQAYIIAGALGSATVRRVIGQFIDGETVEDDSGTTAVLSAVLSDTSSIDFQLVLTKETDAQYLKFDFYNVVPTGSMEFSHNPNEDAPWMLRYPFKVLRTHNFVCDVRP